ncbi:MAG: hypothetical protein DHS80DRAFT_20612 [Piptocephalis tieghemiana]|nr:MAG: hypothetical protein DHS80DRAFT_20612 [Piptocephalis tieghemiana]
MRPVKSVCIIGAGPAGLVSLKRLLDQASESPLEVVVYERSSQVGGTWNYSPTPAKPLDLTQPDAIPTVETTEVIPSPVYPFLRTNLPFATMSLHDFAFPDTGTLYPKHPVVLKYLQDYAKHFKLAPHIHFSTTVIKVEEQSAPEGQEDTYGAWTVVTKDAQGSSSSRSFDAVIVCNGHHNAPFVPDIPGLRSLAATHPSLFSHSRDYRQGDPYRGKTVMTIGDGPSAWDISRNLKDSDCTVHRSMRTAPEKPSLNYTYHLAPKEFSEKGVTFVDGTTLPLPDHIILCTGYHYAFPFMPQYTAGSHVPHLYHQVLHSVHPNLAFMALPTQISPFPLAEYQALYVSKVWSGQVPLPCPDCREADGVLNRSGHDLGPMEQVHYCDWIIRQCGDDSLPLVSQEWIDLRLKGPELRMQELGY